MLFGENKFLENLYRRLIVLLVLLNLTILGSCQSRKKSFDEVFSRCSELSEQGKTEIAITCFENAVKLNAESYSSYIYLAVDYRKLKEFDKAENSIKKALAVYPDRAGAYQIYGEILEQKGDLQKASEKYQKAAELEPDKSIYWINVGLVQERLSNEEKAVESYQKAIKVNPEDTDALYFLSVLYEKQGKFLEAVEVIEKQVRLEKPSEETLQRLKNLKEKQNLQKPKKAN